MSSQKFSRVFRLSRENITSNGNNTQQNAWYSWVPLYPNTNKSKIKVNFKSSGNCLYFSHVLNCTLNSQFTKSKDIHLVVRIKWDPPIFTCLKTAPEGAVGPFLNTNRCSRISCRFEWAQPKGIIQFRLALSRRNLFRLKQQKRLGGIYQSYRCLRCQTRRILLRLECVARCSLGEAP